MRRTLITIVLTGFLTRLLFSGEPGGFVFSERSVYSFKYNAASNLPLNNYFIKEIARFNYLNLYKTNYQLQYEYRVHLQKTGDSAVLVNCFINPLELNGDIFYERFNLSDVMIPSVCNFVISVYDERHLKTATIPVTGCPVSQSPEKTFPVLGTIPDKNPEFELEDVRFTYQPGNKNAFERRISAINNYLACLEVSKFALKKPLSINPDTWEKSLTAFLRIHDLQRILTFLNQQNHDSLTTIPQEYSSQYQSNLQYLDAQIRRLNTIYLQNMDTLTVNLSHDDYKEASAEIISLQKGYLAALIHTNYLFEPAFIHLAHYFSANSGWSTLMDKMKQIFRNSSTEKQRLNPGEFGKLLVESYITVTDSLIAHENFSDAVLMLESAETVCEAISDDDCGLSVFHRLSLSKYGIYDSYLSVASSAIAAGNLSLAHKYLLMARDYQKNNSNLIITAGQVNSNLEQLAWLFLEEGRGKDYNHLTEENLECLDKAWDIYQMINVHDFDHIISRLLQKYSYE